MTTPADAGTYRDPNLPVERRVTDLLARMTVEEKVGLLFQTVLTMNTDGSLADAPDMLPYTAGELVGQQQMNHFNLLGGAGPRQIAEWHNRLQVLAADTRLGIPVTLSSDPRHAFTDNPGTAMRAGAFSQWPETLGLAALDDPELMREYADVVRREYLAVGIRLALHPQIDLATEPRWARVSGTFGEDADLTSRLVTAYLEGLQGPDGHLGADSVAAMVKHFPGAGPQKDGEDAHFVYGREQVYPGGFFDYHLEPFKAAIAAGATQIMPYYGMPVGTSYEEVGFGFNKGVITGLLREQLGFDGIVCTDWGLITDDVIFGQPMPARAWGVEHLTPLERAAKVLDAGADQFGGEWCTDLVVELVRSGRITAARLDQSAGRLLTEKFRLGLFDDRRYVNPDEAEEVVGSRRFRALGDAAQRRSLTLLKNDAGLLPLSDDRPKVYVRGVAADVAAQYGEVVDDPAQADVAVLRLSTPYEPRPGGFEAFFHAGRLDFPADQLAAIQALLNAVPTVVALHLDRPAVIPEIAEDAAALLGVYGASDAALFDVLFGHATPQGRLPFQLPRSMTEVEKSLPDQPQQGPDPLFPLGFGLRYPPV
ncbi:glycoside hydrolase family 3 protein [Streptomyces sp. NPDC102360]|uniref:glycoside hydrolase family 3 protein n=1 Tax=Streptomyces sp. NPDC102360 TaxID=3366160 RepID=UPI003830DFF5